VITYNGEIFNFAELRDQLVHTGHSFRSQSDTEVLLAGWRQWGAGLLPRLVGMFAFAIWDSEMRTLFAARDRFGEKPFLYAASKQRFAFGSDLIACEAMLGETRPVDPAALRALFTLRFTPEPWSIAQGVRKLPAGHFLSFNAQGLKVERWYDLARASSQTQVNVEDAIPGLRQRFDAAVRARLVSDVPVGVFLSGGIDSALVAASAAGFRTRLKTFTVGFEGAGSYYEERPLAAAVARHLGSDHTEIGISADRAGEALDRVFLALDEPFADASAVPTYLISEATRQQVGVVLTGDGADEIFGGYRRYWAELHARLWSRVPLAVRQILTSSLMLMPEGKDNRVSEWLRRARRFVTTADANPVFRQAAWMRLSDERELHMLLGDAPPGRIELERLVGDLRGAANTTDPINTMLACDLALETRTPYLDQRVVEWAFALPGSHKLALKRGWPVGKLILRNAFADRLPSEVFSRPKRGFEIPVAAMLAGPAAGRLAATSNREALARQGLFNPDVIGHWRSELSSDRRETAL